MNNHVLVCDFDEKLISRFQHRKLVVRMENPNLVTHAAKVVQEKNSLYTVWLDMDVLLSQLNVTELEKSSTVPIYLKIAGLGNFQYKLWGQACYFAISRIVLPHGSETTTPLSRSIVPRYLAG